LPLGFFVGVIKTADFPLNKIQLAWGSAMKIALQTIISYIAQVGLIWGFLEAYTYFKDDSLRNALGNYWVLIYFFPILTSFAFVRRLNDLGSHGGKGGNAEVFGEGEALGGKGGHSGRFGAGGNGGNAKVIG
jgi:hypothetical protein